MKLVSGHVPQKTIKKLWKEENYTTSIYPLKKNPRIRNVHRKISLMGMSKKRHMDVLKNNVGSYVVTTVFPHNDISIFNRIFFKNIIIKVDDITCNGKN